MTNDPYRDPNEPGAPGPAAGDSPEPPPESAWMPPADPTAPGATGQTPAGPTPSQEQPYAGQPYPSQPYPSQPYAEQPYPGQQYPGQPYPGQQQPGQQYPHAYPGQAYPGQAYPGQPSPGAGRPTNGLAVAALVCSLAGLVTLISAPVGAVLGHLALRQITQSGEEGTSLAKAAIWVGWIITGLIVLACCGVLALAIITTRAGGDFGPR